MIYVGIDPGLSGGIAAIYDRPGAVEAFPMPVIKTFVKSKTRKTLDLPRLSEYFREVGDVDDVVAVIEKVNSMPKQGIASAFKFGKGAGQIEGVLAAIGIGFELVTPQAWMKSILRGYSRDGGKPSVQYVIQKYPRVSLYPGKHTKPHDGMADAICLAEYAKRLHGSEAA